MYNILNSHSTNLFHGEHLSCANTHLIRAIPPSPKSYITAVAANYAETSLNRPIATSLSPVDAELARLTEGMIISGGVSPHRIALRNCRLLGPAATVAKMLRTAIRNPIPTRSLTLQQNEFLRNTAMLLRNWRKDRTISCHSRRHIFTNITLVIFFLIIA